MTADPVNLSTFPTCTVTVGCENPTAGTVSGAYGPVALCDRCADVLDLDLGPILLTAGQVRGCDTVRIPLAGDNWTPTGEGPTVLVDAVFTADDNRVVIVSYPDVAEYWLDPLTLVELLDRVTP